MSVTDFGCWERWRVSEGRRDSVRRWERCGGSVSYSERAKRGRPPGRMSKMKEQRECNV